MYKQKKYIKILLLIISLVITDKSFAQGEWITLGNLSRGLTGSASVVVDSTIYVLGGFSDSTQNVVDWIQKFDPETGKFTLVTKMKYRRVNLFAAVSDSLIYYGGGEIGPSHHTPGFLECFNLRTGMVTVIDTNRRYNRFFMSGVISDSMLYLVGGQPAEGQQPPGSNPYIMEFNLNKKEITYAYFGMFSNNSLRSGHITMLRNRYIYIFGGNYNTVLSEIYRYSLDNKQLKRIIPNMPVPRSNAAAIINPTSEELLIMGGFNEGNFALNSVVKFKLQDSVSVATQNFQSMNFKRKNFNAVLLNGNIYVFGGTNEYGQLVKAIEKFQLITDVEDEKETKVLLSYRLEQNYPNPFNPSTKIDFHIPSESYVNLTIYNMLGQTVTILRDEVLSSGLYSQNWNASGVNSGVYFYELKTKPLGQKTIENKSFRQIRKMIFLK